MDGHSNAGLLFCLLYCTFHISYGGIIQEKSSNGELADMVLSYVLPLRNEVMDLRSEISKLKSEHSIEISKLRGEFNDEIRQIQADHKDELDKIREEIQIEMANYREVVTKQTNLHNGHTSQVTNSQYKTTQKAHPFDKNVVGRTNSTTEFGNTLPLVKSNEQLSIDAVHYNQNGIISGAERDENGRSDFAHSKETPSSPHDKNSHRIRRAVTGPRVAFLALLSGHAETLGKNQPIRFDNVTTNYGNGYDKNIGMFRAPVAGLYLFSVTITTKYTDTGHCGFYINQNQISWFYMNGAQNSYDSTSQTFIVHLAVGDDVTVRNLDANKSVNGNTHSLFTGALLFEDSEESVNIGK